MELGQKGKGRTFKLYRDVPKCYKATAADTARFEKFLGYWQKFNSLKIQTFK